MPSSLRSRRSPPVADRVEPGREQAPDGRRVLGLDSRGEQRHMLEHVRLHQRENHFSPIALSPLGRTGDIGNGARRFINDAHHASPSGTAFPGRPSVEGAAVPRSQRVCFCPTPRIGSSPSLVPLGTPREAQRRVPERSVASPAPRAIVASLGPGTRARPGEVGHDQMAESPQAPHHRRTTNSAARPVPKVMACQSRGPRIELNILAVE